MDFPFAGASALPSNVTFTRGTAATYFDSTGTLQTVTGNTPRFDYNPSTLSALGLLIEEARTNSIRNNTMQGAVAGTPGTLPTNWSAPSLAGLTSEIVGTGTEDGITYIDIKLSGTTTSAGPLIIGFESVTQIAALSGQTWTGSFYARLVGGTFNNVTPTIKIAEYSAAGTELTNSSPTMSPAPSSAGLRTQRYSVVRPLNNASTASVSLMFRGGTSSGVAVDFTIRIGLPQLELGAFATSVIPTTNAAATRNADVDSSTGAINTGAGTVFVQGTTAGGAGTQYFYSLDDGTADERAYIYRDSSNKIHCIVVDGGVTQCDLDLGAVAANTAFKVAFAYSANDFSASLNGGAVVTDTGGTLPTVTTRRFGQDQAPANYWNGRVARVAEYPRRLPNAYLRSLTA